MKYILILLIFIQASFIFAQDTITTSQAKDFIGEYKYVKGYVAEISITKSGTTYINFDKKYPDNTFTGVIFKKHTGVFNFTIINKDGMLMIYGKIELYKGKPQIILNEPNQMFQVE